MNENPDNRQKKKSHGDFIWSEGQVFSFDQNSGIYKPNHEASGGNDRDNQKTTEPLRVEVSRDTWALGITTVVSIATFLIVALYTFYTQKQVYISESANYNFMKSSRDSTRTTMLTIGQLQRQSSSMEGTLREIKNNDRAFVFASSVITTLYPIKSDESGYTTFIRWQNSGTTSTKNLKIRLFCGSKDQFGSKPFVFPQAPFNYETMIGPKSEQNLWACDSQVSFTIETVNKKGWYVYARATYEDVFGSPHVAETCWKGRLANPSEKTTLFYYPCTDDWSKFNCADKECQDYKQYMKQDAVP